MSFNIYTTKTIVKVRAKVEVKRNFLKNMFFPTEILVDNSQIMMEITKSKEIAAPFVTPIEAGKQMLHRKTKTNIITAPKIGVFKILGENDYYLREAGEEITPKIITKTVEKVKTILEEQEDSIINKEELMVSQFLTTGKVTSMTGEAGYEVDYGVGNIETLPLEELWNNPAVSPSKSLNNLILKAEESGTKIETIVMGFEAADIYMEEAQEKRLLSRDLQSEFVKEVTRIYPGVVWLGTHKTFGVELFKYKRTLTDIQGNKHEVMPTNVVIGGAKGGEVLYAPIFNTSDVNSFPLKKVKRFSYVKNVDDSGQQIITQSRPVLKPMDVDGYFCATVL